MPFLRPRLVLIAFPILLASASLASAADAVRVSLFENLPKDWSWDAPQAQPDDCFEAPAMGFLRVAAKYNERGIQVDRSSPFALHAEASLKVPNGPYRFILRSRGAAQLLIDGKVLTETASIKPNSSGDDEVPQIVPPEDPRWRYVAPGDQEAIAAWTSDGAEHRVELWALIGEKRMRPETGEMSVSLVAPGGVPLLIGGSNQVELTDAGWTSFTESEHKRLDAFDTARRRAAAASEDRYWKSRHELARRETARKLRHDPPGEGNIVDRYVTASLKQAGVEPRPPVDDAAFFRRLALDTIGVVPDAGEVEAFLADARPDKRARAIDARLADPRWADGWMGYWQDVLAENPGILKPTLNNTGPFRRYLYTAFLDNTPFDRFATELIRMEGSPLGGGPAGFGIATQNDVPMAAKAHVLAKAFLAAEMRCARCHDAPFHPYDQADLFGVAALLTGKPITIPGTSTVKRQEGGREPAVSVSLKEGDKVEPQWSLSEIGPDTLPEGLLPPNASMRERLAALITSPRNKRFAPAIANRIWTRYLGVGLVEPVDDWDNEPTTRMPELLDALARELTTHDYDLKHVARVILNARIYQAQVSKNGSREARKDLIAAPARRRMSSEQLVDSLFEAAGKTFAAEELNLDPDGRRPPTEFLNLGTPRRAWEFTSTSNERDRPALSLPVVQSIVDVLQTFGWRPSRQDPITVRDDAITPLQPALLANGVVANRIAQLSDDSKITELCLREQPAADLIRSVYLRILSRAPTESESSRMVAYLGETYEKRVVPGGKTAPPVSWNASRRVSWSNHLSPEATRIQIERERAARAGDPPTARLQPKFRERMEDIVWALINSPEFVFLP